MPKKLWTHRPSWPNYVYARKKYIILILDYCVHWITVCLLGV